MPHFDANDLTRLLVQMAIILLACRLLGRVAARLGQPQVIAEVVAGIVLGPSLLGWLWPDAMHALFPIESMGVLKLLSQVGLVLFMFLVGLEFDARYLRGRAHASVVVSHTSIIAPFLLGLGLAWWMQERYGVPGVPTWTFALFMGVAMSVTAFPVLARILSERHLLQSRVGAIAIACAAVDDVTAWCLLAFVVAVANATGIEQAVWTTGFALAYIAVMLAVVRPFLARLGARLGYGSALPAGTVAAALVMLLLSAATTEVIGIHALFGAFAFGAVLPKEGRFAEALADRIETVAVMLLPLFFAYSGLRTEIGLISTREAWLVTGVIIAVATLGKFGGGALAARLTGLRWREAGAIGILMNTRGLMELIVLNIGLDLGVLSPTVFTMLVLMALVTTFATTPVLALVYPDAELARDRPVEVSTDTAGLPRPYTVLVAIGDGGTGPALATIISALLGRRDAPARVVALHLRAPSDRASVARRQHEEAAQRPPALGPLLERLRSRMIEASPVSFVSVAPSTDIVRTAEATDADLLLLGAHRPLMLEGQLGGTVAGVLAARSAPTAILVDRGLGAIRRVLLVLESESDEDTVTALGRRFAADPDVTVETIGADIQLEQFRRVAGEHDLLVLGVPESGALPLAPAARRFRALLSAAPVSVLAVAGRVPVEASLADNSTSPTHGHVALVDPAAPVAR